MYWVFFWLCYKFDSFSNDAVQHILSNSEQQVWESLSGPQDGLTLNAILHCHGGDL